MPASPNRSSSRDNIVLPPQPISSPHNDLRPPTNDSTMTNKQSRPRRESHAITSIATTTALAPPHRQGNNASPVTTRTEDTTFSLPIDIIDTPDLDELCLSPVGSLPGTRSPSPLSSTPVSLILGTLADIRFIANRMILDYVLYRHWEKINLVQEKLEKNLVP
jgi:hypothetical protein